MRQGKNFGAAALLFAILWCTAAEARIGEVARAARRSGISLVVLRFAEASCPTCQKGANAWRRAAAEHDRRVWFIEVHDRCDAPPARGVDQRICGQTRHVRRSFGNVDGPKTYVWNAWGQRLMDVTPRKLSSAVSSTRREPLTIFAPPKLRPLILRAVAQDRLHQPARGDMRPLKSALCVTQPKAGPRSLVVDQVGERVQLVLHAASCRTRPVTIDPIDLPQTVVRMTREQLPNPEPPQSETFRAKAQAPLQSDYIPPSTGSPESAKARLQAFAASWLGTRHQGDGTGRSGISGAALAQRAVKDALGITLGGRLGEQLNAGPGIPLDKDQPTANLRPGDLLFFVSYAYLPRSVMVYLGDGKVLTSEPIRGVVINDVPRNVPDFLYLVARRPRIPL